MKSTSSERRNPGHLSLLILQPTPFCNLNCDYCYLPDRLNASRMPLEVIGKAVEMAITSGLVGDELTVVWHAGEPFAVPREYYGKAFETVERIAGSVRVHHAMQTNGTLINDHWCEFIKRHNVHVGVSVDGPAFLHDQRRKDRLGRGTHGRVLNGIQSLKRHAIDFHVIAVVTAEALEFADEMFDFFVELGASHVGFNIEELEGAHNASTLASAPDEAGVTRFFTRLLERSKELPPGRMPIREFERAYGAIFSGGYTSAEVALLHNQQAVPFGIISVDYKGNIATFSPEMLGMPRNAVEVFSFGNVLNNSLEDVLSDRHYIQTANEIAEGVRMCASECEYFPFCGGGAPGNKFFENGTFVSSQTMYCRSTIQIPLDVVLADMEAALKLPTARVKGRPAKVPVAYERSGEDKLVQISLV